MSAQVVAVCMSEEKGVQKRPVEEGFIQENHGLAGDAHAGDWHRQVSLLADESAQKMRDQGVDIGPGDFGENLLTRGIDLLSLPLGARLRIGEVELEITQKGKECHTRCAIYHAAGSCVMPTEGVFGRVLHGGAVRPGSTIERCDS